jgi:phosphoglycerol transferase
MGFQIPEDRLGLGTNLFSAKKTLAEQLGFEYINSETHKYSAYYIKEFS